MTLHIAIQNDEINDRFAWVISAAVLGVLIPIGVTFLLYFVCKKSMCCLIFIFLKYSKKIKKSNSCRLNDKFTAYIKEQKKYT